MFLLDTVVLSELRKRPGRRNPHVVAWLGRRAPSELFLSAVTVAEIERGIELRRADDPAFAQALAEWLDTVLRLYDDRILPLTVAIARRWGRLAARIGNPGLDLAIAATALEHGLTVATRDLGDFAPAGVALIDPFAESPRRGRQ
ncbi:MAG: type II toxin-antitoxin system VapC family toxin [Alphaproteobacteria bacterium]|nr:type II toxin-antitoxin system VapC family toxin [Alphaproteobacteria bacterium]